MIDEDILAKLISDKTDLNRREAQAQLDELANVIKSTIDAGQSFEVEGLGTFKEKQNAAVFEPDEVLQTEINQKYAGMRPIELMGSFKETAMERPAARIEPPPDEMETETSPQVPVAESEEAAPKPPAEQAEPKVSAENKKKAKAKSSPRSAEKEPGKQTDESETGTASIVLIVISIIAALALAGWLLYSMGVFSNGKPPSVNQSQVGVVDEAPGMADNLEKASLTTIGNNINNVNANVKSRETENKVYGLKGAVQSEAKDGYTIIVHSLLIKEKAVNAAETIKAKGYRTLILNANVNGRLYWRVGIGQFKTIADAKKATKTLLEPYKSNNFIKHQ